MIHFFSNPTNISFAALALAFIILLAWLIHLEIRLRRFLIGNGSKNIDDSFVHINSSLEELAKFRKELEEYLHTVEKRLRQSVQGIHTVRFNPFKGTGSGGNQSFATAFINQEGDGVVFSSLYSRDRVSIFSKPVTKYNSEFELTKEERDAIGTAKQNLTK